MATACLVSAGCKSKGGNGAPALPRATNVGLAFDRLRHDGDLVVIEVGEALQGGVDLNGDGDALDDVLHVHDVTTGTTTDLGFDVRGFVVDSGRVAFLVNEAGQGQTDLNGDGDANDLVLHVYSADLGIVSNLRLAAAEDLHLEGDLLAFLVPEQDQGVDLDGDGDHLDSVVHLNDVGTGVTTNLGLAVTGSVSLAGDVLAFAVDEAAQGMTDLNGDGDAADAVLHTFVAGTGVTNLGLAVSILFLAGQLADFELGHGIVAVDVPEEDQGATDLNGDGDTGDAVLHVHDVRSGTTTNLEVAMQAGQYRVGERYVALLATEALQGNTDLNNDGDASDDVLLVHDVATAVTTDTRLATFRFSLADELIFVEVLESAQAGADLNNDGDALDSVLIVWNASTGLLDNPGFAAERPHRIGMDRIAFEVREQFQGDTDLNGDGDTLDRILFLYDLVGAAPTNLGVTGSILATDDSRLAYLAFEEALDLNGDGDMLDHVLQFYSTTTGRTSNLGLAGSGTDSAGIPFGLRDGLQPFAADEIQQGQGDLNGDGDALDPAVLFLVEPAP